MILEEALWTVVLLLLVLALLFPKTRSLKPLAVVAALIATVSLVFVVKREKPMTLPAKPPPVSDQAPVDFERFHVEKLDLADPEAKSRIPVGNIRFAEIRSESGVERGTIAQVTARLYNDSKTYTLTDYGYELVIQDCIDAVCKTVFEQEGLAAVSVPPTQARDVSIPIRGDGTRDAPPIRILGTASLLLTPTETRAQPASKTGE